MEYKKAITFIGLIFIGFGSLHAQESPVASGSDAAGAGGTSSYSVGQVVYTTNTGTNGSVSQGVQQPYEISVTTGLNETTINLELSVYPNPTTNYITLNIESTNSLSFQLIDFQGKVIEQQKLTENSTIIKMERLPKAIYFLQVSDKNKTVKTFKIIKN